MVIGVIVAIAAYLQSHNTSNPLGQRDAIIIGLVGVTVTRDRRGAVHPRFARVVPALLAGPPDLRAEGPDGPHRRGPVGAPPPAMPDAPTPDELGARLGHLGIAIRDEVLAHREARDPHELTAVVGEVTADVTYEIDRVSEVRVVEWLRAHWPASEPVRLVMEGLEDEQLVTVPDGVDPAEVRWVCIVDPVDGSRNLMFDKRSGWVLAAVAPATPGADGRPGARLPDVVAAAMTEIPTTRTWRADQYRAVRGRGPAGVTATSEDLRTGEHAAVRLAPSTATSFRHGFASFSHFLPDGKAWLAAVEQEVWDALEPPDGSPRQIFEDQYLCSAGQLAEIMAGRDRMVGDLRPFGLRAVGLPPTLTCHPYDVCTASILTELGGVFEDPFGGPVDVALDTTSPVAYMAYANEDLAARVRPVLREALTRAGVTG